MSAAGAGSALSYAGAAGERATARRRDGGRARRSRAATITSLCYVAVPVLLVVAWQIGSSTGALDRSVVASPSDVVRVAGRMIRDGSLPTAIEVSVRRVLLGSLVGVLLGVSLGLFAGLTRTGRRLLDGPMHMLQAMPFPALIPLLMIWLGIGEDLKVGLVAIGVVFPIYLNFSKGIRGIDPRYAELAATRGLSRWQLTTQVILPGALPALLVGLRFALAIAWLCLVFGETIAADSGIGYLMMQAKLFNQTDVIILGLVIYSVLGLLVDALVRVIERIALPWRREFVA